MNKVLQNKWYWLTLLLGTVIFYILNINTSMWGDDYIYALIPGNESQRCDTLGKYLASMAYFYNDTNGRIADMIVRFISSLVGKTVFNLLNTAVFALFVHTVAKLINRAERNTWLLAIIFLYVLLLFPYPGETMLWMAGAVNYMWSATATMLVLLYMVQHNETGNHKASVMGHIGLAICAFIAGGMNESITTATLVAMGGYFLFNFKQWRGTNVTITIAYLLGTILIISSPAAWTRLASGSSVNLNMGITGILTQRVYNLITKTGHYVTPFLGLCTLCFLLWKKHIKETAGNMINWTVIGAMVSVTVFGVLDPRAYTWYSLTGFVVVMLLLCHTINSKPKTANIIGIAVALATLYPTWDALKTTYDYKQYDDKVLSDISKSPEGVVLAYPTPEPTRFYHPLHYDNHIATCWNMFMGWYLGKENIEFVSDSIYARYNNPLPLTQGGEVLNYSSSDTTWAQNIYGFRGADYSIIPIECDSVIDRQGLHSKLYYNDIVAHIGADRVEKRKLWGKMRDHEPFSQYHLKHDGKMYVILPALNDSITRIEIPVKVGKKNDVLIFNHK